MNTPTTKHTCGGPVFGQRTPGCPRCDELDSGAAPVRWAVRQRPAPATMRENLNAHLNSDNHRTGCRPVCTYGDW